MRLLATLDKVGLNTFFLLLLLMVGLAWLFPTYGGEESPIPLKQISTYGVSVIFFFYGLKLDPAKLWAGLSHWKLHLAIQSTTFLVFPVIILLLYWFFHSPGFDLWWLGVFYLAALPSTVSSSVVMVSMAGGNVAAAIFNASISSLIGVFITPIWMSLFISSAGQDKADLDGVILHLCIQVLLPVILGLLLHRKLNFIMVRYGAWLQYFDQIIILIIVYRAFAESFLGDRFAGFSLGEIIILSILMLLLFLFVAGLMLITAYKMGFTREDRITMLFCGSKKSLVQGAVMGQVLFSNASGMGIIMLPLMLYHSLQLMAGSIIAQRLSR